MVRRLFPSGRYAYPTAHRYGRAHGYAGSDSRADSHRYTDSRTDPDPDAAGCRRRAGG